MSASGPGCVKTLTSNLRVEILSRLRRIGKEQHWQSQSKEEKGENNSAHSLLVRVFTQPWSNSEVSLLARPVRCTLKGGRRQAAPAGPFRARSGRAARRDVTLGHLRRLRTISRQRFILPVDPIDVMRFEVAGDGCTNGREERLFAKMCEQSESLQLVFDWIFELGKT